MALDVIFGQNDSFVLCWLIFSLVAWERWRRRPGRRESGGWMLALSTVCFGLACASKPTAWFLAPFYALLLVADLPLTGSAAAGLGATLRQLLRRAWPGALAFLLIVLPYVIWDPAAIYDDTWRWSSGQGETGYQIWGWGGSNFVLALGLVADRFAQWPFWVPMIALAAPLLLWLLWRQVRANSLSNACWHYGLFMLGFFYVSRFLNENYLGYILAFLAIGILTALPADEGHAPT
jgi:hypothetical protein